MRLLITGSFCSPGSLFLCLMGFLSYITVTFTVEAQAAANALLVVKAQVSVLLTSAC